MSRSDRKNRKRAYWLRGKIMTWVRLAFREGILTVERNPAYTSQIAPIVTCWATVATIVFSAARTPPTDTKRIRILWA